MRLLATLLKLAALGVALAIVAGHLGWLHPALDSFSHLRMQLLMFAVVLAVALAASRRWEGLALMALALASLLATMGTIIRPGAGGGRADITILQQNLLHDNAEVDAFLARVREAEPDVIALQELKAANEAILPALSNDYPHLHRCRGGGRVGDVAILSRLPPGTRVRRACLPGLAIASVRVGEGPGARDVGIGSLHLSWPWPFGQDRHLESIERVLPKLTTPAALVGDFNAVTWSASVRRLARTIGGEVVPRPTGTRVEPDLPPLLRWAWDIPIDHAVVSGMIVLDSVAIPLRGSDHDTLVTRLALPPAAPPEREAWLNRGGRGALPVPRKALAEHADLMHDVALNARFMGGVHDLGEAESEGQNDREGPDGAKAEHGASLSLMERKLAGDA